MAKLSFLGAARTTTGSKHLLQWEGEQVTRRLMIDCGMFQGLKKLRLKNWDPFPLDPSLIDAIVLTHGHLDHVGYLPRLVREGFDGPIYATSATIDLAELILRDSAHIQMEDARLARKFGYSKHKDPQPLYTDKDVEKVLPLFKPLDYFHSYEILEGCTVRLHHSGHILGSAFVEATVEEEGELIRVVFSGDVGRFHQPILQDPEPPTGADYFVLEGTYGNRTHSTKDPLVEIEEVVNRTVKRGGSVVIPSFAVGRSQQLLYYLAELLDKNRIPKVDVFLDSPMAVAVTNKVRKHEEELDLQTLLGVREHRLFQRPEIHLLETREQSQTLNDRQDPCIIISASGMATAGRILHHLSRRLPDRKNTVLLVGYQGEGTRGRRLLEGEDEVKIHGQMVPVRAEVVSMSSLSAHADYTEMMPWLRRMIPPSLTFMVHGEMDSLTEFSELLKSKLGWTTYIPDINESVELTPVQPGKKTEPLRVTHLEAEKTGAAVERPNVAAVLEESAQLPDTFEGAYEFHPPLDEKLAKRILATKAHLVLILADGGSGEDADTFTRMLREDGREVWKMTPAQ